MRVHVKILGAITRPTGKDEFDYEVADGSCLEELLLKLGYHQNHLRFFVPAINGTQAGLGQALKANDDITLFMPMSGG